MNSAWRALARSSGTDYRQAAAFMSATEGRSGQRAFARFQASPSGARLLVFSDGVFEVFQGADRVGTWQDFLAGFSLPEVRKLRPAERFHRALKARGADTLEDDFSLLELRFA